MYQAMQLYPKKFMYITVRELTMTRTGGLGLLTLITKTHHSVHIDWGERSCSVVRHGSPNMELVSSDGMLESVRAIIHCVSMS